MAIVTLKAGTVIVDSLCDPELKLVAHKVPDPYYPGQECWAISKSQLKLMDPEAGNRPSWRPTLMFNEDEVQVVG